MISNFEHIGPNKWSVLIDGRRVDITAHTPNAAIRAALQIARMASQSTLEEAIKCFNCTT